MADAVIPTSVGSPHKLNFKIISSDNSETLEDPSQKDLFDPHFEL
jgi:hypothetical protein